MSDRYSVEFCDGDTEETMWLAWVGYLVEIATEDGQRRCVRIRCVDRDEYGFPTIEGDVWGAVGDPPIPVRIPVTEILAVKVM